MTVAPAFLAYCTSSVPMPPHGRGDEDDGVRAEWGEAEDAEGGAAGADHGDGFGVVESFGYGVELVGLGDGEFGVAAGGVADVGDDVAAEPGGVGALAE